MGDGGNALSERGMRRVLARRALLVSGAATVLGCRSGQAASRVARPHHAKSVLLAHPHLVGRAAAPLPLVMLDPGHGGKDPGAIGFAGTYEKHIAMAAATELQARLHHSGRYRCLLTRDDDRFIPLADRVAIAQGRAAALFVSMHADAIASSHAVRGASVYTLAPTASDAQTASLARRENSADRFAGPRFHAPSAAVEDILASLVRQETRGGSAHMARGVVSALAPEIGLLPNPSRHAGFAVLQAPDIPSVLVEMGFMSNPQDEALLRTPAHRARITVAMLTAIDGFFAAPGFTRLQG